MLIQELTIDIDQNRISWSSHHGSTSSFIMGDDINYFLSESFFFSVPSDSYIFHAPSQTLTAFLPFLFCYLSVSTSSATASAELFSQVRDTEWYGWRCYRGSHWDTDNVNTFCPYWSLDNRCLQSTTIHQSKGIMATAGYEFNTVNKCLFGMPLWYMDARHHYAMKEALYRRQWSRGGMHAKM